MAEMKCWITWEDCRYLQLTEAAQLQRLAEPAFVTFLAFARDPAAYEVFVQGEPIYIDGAILVGGAATPQGRSAAVALGVADLLTAEDMVSDLHLRQPSDWHDFIALRCCWATELFDYLGYRMIRATRTTRTIIAADARTQCWLRRRASSVSVEKGDRQFRALDVCVVTEARERDRWDAQPGKLLIGVHWVVLAAGKGHRGLGPRQQLRHVGRPDRERTRIHGHPPSAVLLTQSGVHGWVTGGRPGQT